MSACIKLDESGRYRVHITVCEVGHNHSLSKQRFTCYPKQRLQLDARTREEVAILARRRAPNHEIHDHILENTDCVPRRYDVRNLVWRMKNSTSQDKQVAPRVQSWIENFTQKEGNVASVYHDEDKVGNA